MDRLTERSIFQSLPALVRDKTLFVIAHQYSTIEDSNRILLLDENGLITMGTHGSLMETSAYYQSLLGSRWKEPGIGALRQC